jgi:hypothetical protein
VLGDLPSRALLERIRDGLAGAPPEGLTRAIYRAWKRITTLGMLARKTADGRIEGLAADAGAAWRKSQGSAAPRPTEATRQQEDEQRALVLEYEYFREQEVWALFEALGSDALEGRRAEKRNYLKGQGRWDRIAPDVRIREVDDLIRLDLVKGVAPFEEWLKWKREAETP